MTDEEKLEYDAKRVRTRELAAEFNSKGDPLGWFDALYKEAGGDIEQIPWADLEPNRYFADWAAQTNLSGDGRRALVVGCGLGDDAKFLNDLGFKVTAFDISPNAIAWAKKLYGGVAIDFKVGDLLNPDPAWLGAFDFVLEIYTIQPLPIELRPQVIDAVASFVGPGGRLVVVTRGRGDDDPVDEVPWPLSRRDLSRFDANGLRQLSLQEIWEPENEQLRFVIEYERSEGEHRPAVGGPVGKGVE